MSRKFRQYLSALVLWAGVLCCPVYGQVAPTAIDSELLKESVEAVLGSSRPVAWKTLSLSGLDEKKLELRQRKTLPDSLHIGRIETEDGARWIIPEIAPSKSETYSFLLYLDEEMSIVDVDVLKYRESYGNEIDYSFFRRQFHGMSKPGEIRFGRSIQNISGATISARSMTYAVHDLMSIVTNIELK